MSEVEKYQPRAELLKAKITYARALADSGLLPESYRKKPENVLYAIEFGDMLGLAPMAAIQGINVIAGKPTASASLIGGLVRRAGHRLRVSGDDKKAVAVIVRKDDPEFEFRSEWTLDRARKAGLVGKDNWKNYPEAMLTARAVTEVARAACPEALMGLQYTAEELGATVDEDGHVVAEPQPEPDPVADAARAAALESLRQRINQASTPEELLDVRMAARAKYGAGEIAKDHADELAVLFDAKEAELAVVDAEIVQDTLDATDEEITAVMENDRERHAK